jgi:serine O-acetyltransferase
MFDNLRADLRAYHGKWWEQGFWVMVVYRFGRWRYGIRNKWLRKPFSLVYKIAHKLAQITTGIDLPCEVAVGRNFVIDHFGGIIISGYTRFGDNCRIRNGVCVGLRRIEEPCAPVIGNNVDIGAGAKLLGNITIGDNVLIGANAVVITDVPDNCVAMGVPAVIRPRRDRVGRDAANSRSFDWLEQEMLRQIEREASRDTQRALAPASAQRLSLSRSISVICVALFSGIVLSITAW